MGFIFLRVLFIFVMGTVGYFLPPLSLENLYGAIIGVLIGIIVVFILNI